MIQLEVISVSHKSCSTVCTVVTVWPTTPDKEGKLIGEKFSRQGAEWETVELRIKEEERPTIQVGPLTGKAFIAGGTGEGGITGVIKIVINDPELFGSFKVGDIVSLEPKRQLKTEKDN